MMRCTYKLHDGQLSKVHIVQAHHECACAAGKTVLRIPKQLQQPHHLHSQQVAS